MKLTELKLKEMILETMENSNPEIESQIERTSAAIHLYETGELTNLDALTRSLIKGVVGSIRGGPAYASATVEFKRKAEELGVLDQVTAAVLSLTKEDTSSEIRLKEELLREDAKGPRDLPDDAYVRVFTRGKDGRKGVRLITVMLTDKDGNMRPPVDMYSGEDNPVWGDVSFYEKNPSSMPCDDAAIIDVTQAADGWGPFLYDIAMEIATMNSNGLAPDRLVVSDEAQEVWDFYSKNRPDVQEFQMDDEYNSLTPEKEDNCRQFMSRDTTSFSDWHTSPLSRRYKKEPTILNLIRDKLIWEL